jgi:competence ComEA-like helix-hairpin-helix protein
MRTDKITEHGNAEQNRTQIFAFAIAAFVAVVLSCCFVGWSAKSKQPPQLPAQLSEVAVKLEGRINPNIASMPSLVRLPQIGASRAEAIIAYREYVSRSNNGAAFRNCDDLQKVKGIGSEIAGNLCKWLKFE